MNYWYSYCKVLFILQFTSTGIQLNKMSDKGVTQLFLWIWNYHDVNIDREVKKILLLNFMKTILLF